MSGGLGVAVVSSLVMIVRALLGRPLIQASAADKISGTAVKLIEQASKDADDARREAAEARRDASEARREANDARRAAEDAAREVRMLKSAILSPYATLDGLRALISEGPGNGIPRAPVSQP